MRLDIRVSVVLFIGAFVFSSHLALAQTINNGQAKNAIERSSNAARIFETAMGGGDKGIPKELLQKAEAIAVFPHLVKAKFLIEHITISYGVICRRLSSGWSLPAYFTFGGAGFEFNMAGGESSDVIMLFMNKDAASWLEKGGFILKDDKKAVSGEIGQLSDEQRQALGKANLIIYSIKDGQFIGKTFDSKFYNSFMTTGDNKLNKAVYGIKSGETLQGKQSKSKTYPKDVTTFQQSLFKHLP